MSALGTMLRRMVAGVLIAAVSALLLATIVAPTILGAERFHITTQSMLPHYPPGTLVVAQPVDALTLRIGDVISYRAPRMHDAVITHRIAGLRAHSAVGTRFIMRGDNNAVNDAEPVAPSSIIGVVRYAVPWVGALSEWQRNDVLKIALPVIGCGLIAWGCLPKRSTSRGRSRGSEQ